MHEAADRIEALEAEVGRLRAGMSQAAADVLAERRRQVEVEGFTARHDGRHKPGWLARAGAWYALNASTHERVGRGSCADMFFLGPRDRFGWPWDLGWWKPGKPRRDLVKAGALIIAEIERLDRAALSPKPEGE